MSIYDQLKLALLPIDIIEGKPTQNIETAIDQIKQLPMGIDIAVLPELFTTGFVADKEASMALAQTDTGETMTRIKQCARDKGLAICGSFLARDGEDIYNKAFFVEPGGETTYYDKRHLFVLSEESEILTAGNKLPRSIRYRGWNISMVICYDVRFPVWCRNQKLSYDLLLIPANWPQKRQFAWRTLLQARAIENQAYVAGANRSGQDKYGEYDNLSWVFDYMGKECSEEKDGVIYATLSKEKLNQYREKFPFWNSADACLIVREQ